MNSVSMDGLPIGWFDLIVLALLVTGALRGRKLGMSEGLLPMLKWIAIVIFAALFYKPLGTFIKGFGDFGELTSYVAAFITCVLLVFIAFSIVKKLIGGKPISADKFGKSEYYLGVSAGVVQFVCILIVALSFLNAREFTQKEIRERQAYELDVYGSSFFPSLQSTQAFVFNDSFIGTTLRRYGSGLLIEPTIHRTKLYQQQQWQMP